MPRARDVARAAAFALGIAALAGCVSLSVPEAQDTIAVLDKTPPEVPRRTSRRPLVLLVYPPETSRTYDTTRMAYSVRPHEVAYFSRHQWGDTPGRMLQPLLLRTLERTGRFSAVVTPPYAGREAYALRTQILELTQDFTSASPVLRLSLRLRLSNEASGSVATKDVALREPMREKAPSAGIAAANDAAADALLEIARFVLQRAD